MSTNIPESGPARPERLTAAGPSREFDEKVAGNIHLHPAYVASPSKRLTCQGKTMEGAIFLFLSDMLETIIAASEMWVHAFLSWHVGDERFRLDRQEVRKL